MGFSLLKEALQDLHQTQQLTLQDSLVEQVLSRGRVVVWGRWYTGPR